MRTVPPGRVTRVSSAITSSGRGTWCSVRNVPATSNDARSKPSLAMSPSTNVRFAGALDRPRWISSGTSSTATTSRTSGASAKASAPVPAPASSARSSPVSGTNSRTSAANSSERRSWSAAIRSAVAAKRARVASCVLKRLLFRCDRACSALLCDLLEQPPDLGPGRDLEFPPAHERLLRLRPSRPNHGFLELPCAEECERLERPRLARPTKAVDRPGRGVDRRLGPQQRLREPARLVRDRKRLQLLAEDDHEVVVRVIRRFAPV